MKNRILIECVRAGQPAPYADSIYVYVVTFEHVMTYGPESGEWVARKGVNEESALLAVKAAGRKFKTKDEKPEWHETRLTGVERLGDGKFKVSLVQEYTG